MANIIKQFIKNPPENYEAFYYEHHNKTTNKKYGGKHKGQVGDGYWHSSENPDMQDDWQNLNHEWEYHVKHYGSDDYILNVEKDILVKHSARESDDWYNLTNGGESYPHSDVSAIQKLVNDIVNGVYLQKDKLTKPQLENLLRDDKRHQVRTEEDTKKEVELATRIDDVGDTRYCDPVTLLEDRNGPGDHKLVDGSTTGNGILKSKHGKKSDYNLVPYDIHKNLSNADLDLIGLLLNPKPKIKKWESKRIDWANSFARAKHEESRPINSQENRQLLQSANFNSKQIYSVFKKADELYKEQKFTNAGTPWIKYKLKKNKPLLEQAESNILKKFPKSMVHIFSSEKYRWEKLVFDLIDNQKLSVKNKKKKTELRIIIHYPKTISEKAWNKHLTEIDKYTRELCNNFDMIFRGFTYMDTI